MAYDNTNRWTLNKNANKQSETHADYKGSVNFEGIDCWLDGWIKDGPNGKFISGNIKRKQPAQTSTEKTSFTPRHNPNITSGLQKQNIMPDDDMDDEIPF